MFALSRPTHHGSTPRGTPGNFGPKWPTPCWFERRRHSIANCDRMVTDSTTFTMESLCETTIALSNGAIADPLRPPLPPKWGFYMLPRYTNGCICATGDPIRFMFGFRVGFSGSVDRMALFPVTSNPGWWPAASLDNFNGHISATAYSIHLCSTHRVVIFALAHLSGYSCDIVVL